VTAEAAQKFNADRTTVDLFFRGLVSRDLGVVFLASISVNEGFERLVDARHVFVGAGIFANVGVVFLSQTPIGFSERFWFCRRPHTEDFVVTCQGFQMCYAAR
jgi:hypothetical protein